MPSSKLDWGNPMSSAHDRSKLTDPARCLREAERLVIPVTPENWGLVADDADELNVLQAAITHLVYLDTERTEFQEKVMQIVFTAYLMGRTAGDRRPAITPEAFRELIEGLDLSDLDQ
jgi:hypothetical protein